MAAQPQPTPTCTWTGKSGKKYTYNVYKISEQINWSSVAGNYIFAKVTPQNTWSAVYAGETSDFSSRFTNHHAQQCIDRNGGTHIHARANAGGDQARRDEEKDIRDNYDPPCNKQ
jgi:hypothetical protein